MMGRIAGLLTLVIQFVLVRGQCPWPSDEARLSESCVCAYNLGKEISVQCDQVDYPALLTALSNSVTNVPVNLLLVTNSSIRTLDNESFRLLQIESIQFSGCDIRVVHPRAFAGQEESLRNLNLQRNLLDEVPVAALRNLRQLTLLDLSDNKISQIPEKSFVTLKLNTLKLADNNLSLATGAFSGLEDSLKNLNLKGSKLQGIPQALRDLRTLSFLDLAQNNIRSVPADILATLESLAALNLERNLISNLDPSVFLGVSDTLSSLSLLNNLIRDFPSEALGPLKELRVLDIGFNLIREIPEDAFTNLSALTLLALDGNPISTLPFQAFQSLSSSLKGLSVGGRFLKCDCRIQWVAEWVQEHELQITSREKNPQFCGSPPELKDVNFYDLSPNDLTCEDPFKDAILNFTKFEEIPLTLPSTSQSPVSLNEISAVATNAPISTSTNAPTTTTTTSVPQTTTPVVFNNPITDNTPRIIITTTGVNHFPARGSVEIDTQHDQRVRPAQTRPSLVLRPQDRVGSRKKAGPLSSFRDQSDEFTVKDAYRQDHSIIIQWDSKVTNILGFRVVYRLFGENNFKLGPPLGSNEREFKIKNVPLQECIVVCVMSLEDVIITPETVPFSQCREMKTESNNQSYMDKIIIAASAAICGTVIIAVTVFVCCNRRRGVNFEKENPPSIFATTAAPPLASLGTLGGQLKDWDQLSMYSARSIPRARMYHLEKGSINGSYIPEDARSHLSHLSHVSQLSHISSKSKARSLADGQSQRSYSGVSGRYIPTGSLHHAPSLSRPGSASSFWQQSLLGNDKGMRDNNLVQL